MSESEYIRKQLPVIDQIIKNAQSKIQEITGIKIQLSISEIEANNNTEKQVLELAITACDRWGMTYQQMLERRGNQDVTSKRKLLAIVIKKRFPQTTLKQLASLIGQGDHSSALTALQTGKRLIEVNDPIIMKYYELIKDLLNETPKAVQTEDEA